MDNNTRILGMPSTNNKTLILNPTEQRPFRGVRLQLSKKKRGTLREKNRKSIFQLLAFS